MHYQSDRAVIAVWFARWRRRARQAIIAGASIVVLIASHRFASADGFQVLHSFTQAEGAEPYGGLTLVGSTLYGTTSTLGANHFGSIFSVGLDGSGFQTVYAFTGGSDGSRPEAGLTLIGSKLFGTAENGGSGTVFSINPDGSSFRNLHAFTGSGGEGSGPRSSLTLIGSTLYGTTSSGGPNNQGTIYSVSQSGSTFQTDYGFAGSPGAAEPFAGIAAVGGTVFGTTYFGGANNLGTLFSTNVTGGNFQIINSFAGGTAGAHPSADLVAVGSKLIGTTTGGGNTGFGSIFSINQDGTNFQTLYAFTGGVNGNGPVAALTQVGSKLYGTTQSGGQRSAGTVFSINVDGSGYQILHSFDGASGGGIPNGPLTAVGSTLYGMTIEGGALNQGTVYAITIPEPSTWTIALCALVTLALRTGRRMTAALPR